MGQIALIGNLIENHRLVIPHAVFVGELCAFVDILALDAAVCDPRRSVIIERQAVVNGAQTAVGVVGAEQGGNAFPVGNGLFLQNIIFVRHAPPHVAVSRKPGDQVAHIALVVRRAHLGKAPAVIGVEHNDVGFNAHVHQLPDAVLHILEMYGIEPREVPVIAGVIRLKAHEIVARHPLRAARRALIRKCDRVLEVEIVMLREHAEPDLVEIPI